MTQFLVRRTLQTLLVLLATVAIIVLVLSGAPGAFENWAVSSQLDSGASVLGVIGQHLPKTLLLVLLSMMLAISLALPLGMRAAARPRMPIFTGLTWIGASLPAFWLALLLIAAVNQGGVSDLPALVLPTIVLTLINLATLSRFVQSAMREALSQPFVRVARARGLTQQTITRRYALRSARVPLVNALIWTIPALVGGTIVTESVLDYRGVGWLFLQALRAGDWPIVGALLLLTALLVAIANIVADLVYGRVDRSTGSF